MGTVRWAVSFMVVAAAFVVLPQRSCADAGPVSFPGPDEGYTITKSDIEQVAPPGYEGRTNTVTGTAVGDSPYTTGKRVVLRFTLGNEIKTCPNADGTAEGTGLFNMSLDSTTVAADGTRTIHIEVTAKAKYKGQVGEDAWMQGPVNADIDYTYTLTGSLRGTSGALAASPGTSYAQHITIPILVSKVGMSSPDIGKLTGGDPTQGHYAEAFGTGIAVAYWAGFYYSVAETKWRQGECAQISFDPPSKTMQPVLGGQTTVKATLKTKGGESVAANFQNARTEIGSVDPSAGSSTTGSPMAFIYTAPNKPAPANKTAGFQVDAVSHAGIAGKTWIAGLGSGWNGVISCSSIAEGDEGNNALQTWSGSQALQVLIEVTNGVGKASAYSEMNATAENRRNAYRGGSTVVIFDNSSSLAGTVEGYSGATVDVSMDKSAGSYSIKAGLSPAIKPGQIRSVICSSSSCKSETLPFYIQACLPGEIDGKTSTLNRLQGTRTDVKTGLGRAHNGTATNTLTWNLARTGTH